MATKTKRLQGRRSEKTLLATKKPDPALTHANRVAKLINTVCCCDAILMKPDRSRYHKLVKLIYQHPYLFSQLLEGYELNPQCKLSEQLIIPYDVNFDFLNKNIQISFSPFIAANQIIHPTGATQCCLTALVAALDLEHYSCTIRSETSPRIYFTKKRVNNLTINIKMPPTQHQQFMLILGISYMGAETYDAVRILGIEADNSKLFIRKSDTLHDMDFNDEAPF